MIPEQLKNMAASYPGSPITTAAIERAYQKRIPQGITDSVALLDLLEQWEAESPFEQMIKKNIAARRTLTYFETEGIYFDGDEHIRFDFEGSADVVYRATLYASISTSGSTRLCVADLDGDYETIDELARAIADRIDYDPAMEVDWDSEASYESHGDCDVDWDSGELDSYGGSERRCGDREIRELAEFLVENEIITLT